MPNMKNAKKAVRQNPKKNELNNNFKASMNTAIKNVEKAVIANDKEKANANLKVAIKRIDKAASKGIVHKNYVARNKSRLTKKVNALIKINSKRIYFFCIFRYNKYGDILEKIIYVFTLSNTRTIYLYL